MNKLSLIQQIQRFSNWNQLAEFYYFFSGNRNTISNSPLNQNYNDFLNLPVSIQVGTFLSIKLLIHWINDGFMAVFFVLVGMEVKEII